MKTTYSRLRCKFFPLLLLTVIPLTAQAFLFEYPLPTTSQSLQIDASSPSGLVYFVDRGGAAPTIDQLDPIFNKLTLWPTPFAPTVPGGIVVDQLSPTQFVYVTDLPQTTLGQLDVINDIYYKYNLTLLPFNIMGGPRQLVYDTSWSVEPFDLVWFCTSGAAGTGSVPMIAYFNPTTFMFRVWFLPNTVASPGESIDGLAFNLTYGTPTVYFAVNGPVHNNISSLLPLAGGFVNVWPLPATYTQPAPIVANTSGDVFRVQCTFAGCNTQARLRTGANMLDQWVSIAGDTTPDLFLTLDPVTSVSRFTALRGATPTSDLLMPACPANMIPLNPYYDYAQSTIYPLFPQRIPVPRATLDVPPRVSNLNVDAHCPFLRNVQISSGGPISMDTGNNTWISETSAQFIATHP